MFMCVCVCVCVRLCVYMELFKKSLRDAIRGLDLSRQLCDIVFIIQQTRDIDTAPANTTLAQHWLKVLRLLGIEPGVE